MTTIFNQFVRSLSFFLLSTYSAYSSYVVQWTYGIHIIFRTRRNAMAYYSLLWFWQFFLNSSFALSAAAAAAMCVRLWKNYGFRKICVWLRNIVHASSGNNSSSSRRMKKYLRARHNRSLMLLKITCIISEFVHFTDVMQCFYVYFNFSFFFKCNFMFDLSRSVRIGSTLFARFFIHTHRQAYEHMHGTAYCFPFAFHSFE